ncbi:MAG: hypothetical protein II456_00320 [Firmicutes bacterium]|nr:hypothetical protein [Bacillota bacterium]
MEKKLVYGQLAFVLLMTYVVIFVTPMRMAFGVLCIVLSSVLILVDEYWLVKKAGTAKESTIVAVILTLNLTFLLFLRCMLQILA